MDRITQNEVVDALIAALSPPPAPTRADGWWTMLELTEHFHVTAREIQYRLQKLGAAVERQRYRGRSYYRFKGQP